MLTDKLTTSDMTITISSKATSPFLAVASLSFWVSAVGCWGLARQVQEVEAECDVGNCKPEYQPAICDLDEGGRGKVQQDHVYNTSHLF